MESIFIFNNSFIALNMEYFVQNFFRFLVLSYYCF